MPVNSEYIELLVLEKLAGIITPEDNAILEKILAEEPAAREIWEAINRKFADNHLSAVRKDLENTIVGDKILAVAEAQERLAQKTRKIKWLAAGSMVAASLVGYLLINFHPTKEVLAAQTATPINVTLSMEGQTIPLSELTKEKARKIAAGKMEATTKQARLIKADATTTLIDDNGILHCPPTNNHQLAKVTVPLQKRYQIVLSDDTKIMLNAGTEITFPLGFNGNTRDISIKGQAYLEVAPNPNKPFIVHLPDNEVKVLGTSFDVNTYNPEHVQVALVKGSVNVYAMADSVRLTPGKIATCRQGTRLQTTTFDTNTVLAWQTGIYNFNDEQPLSEVMDIIHREYGIDITYDDPAVKNRKVLAWLDVATADLPAFMTNLKIAQICNYQFTRTGKDSVLHISSMH